MSFLLAIALSAQAAQPRESAQSLVGQWTDCLTVAADAYAKSAETADIVAKAAMGKCSHHEPQIRQSVFSMQLGLYQKLPGSRIPDTIDRAEAATSREMDDLRRRRYDALLARTIEARAIAVPGS